MAEDVENVSVVETEIGTLGEAPVDVAQAENSLPAQDGEDSSGAQVFSPGTVIETAERESAEQVAEENGAALGKGGGDDGRAPLTARGREEVDNKKEESRAALIERIEQAEALRKEKEENFGMSLKDLVKMLDFIANPELQAKLKDRLTSSIGEKRAEKAMAELNELHQLKKKQEKGVALSPEECARLERLKKSEDLKLAVQQAQDMRNEMELKTNGAATKAIGEEINLAGVGIKAINVSTQQKASFESYSDSGIQAEQITSKYNIAATANKNEVKIPESKVAYANVAQIKITDPAMTALTV